MQWDSGWVLLDMCVIYIKSECEKKTLKSLNLNTLFGLITLFGFKRYKKLSRNYLLDIY